MKYLLSRHDEMIVVCLMVSTCASIRFLFDGVSFSLWGHALTFSHVDAMAYTALLTPVLAAHGYIKVNKKKVKSDDSKN